MKNKFVNILMIACLVVASLSSCKKYLDQQPITEIGTQAVFSDVPSAYKALIGVYSRLVGDAGYGIRLSLYYTVDNDEVQGPSGAVDNDRRDIARYSASSSNAQLTNPFNQIFQGIEFANICIDNIPQMSLYSNGSDQQKKQLQRMYGEALTLRANYYLEAIRNWGDLPAQFQPAYTLAASNPFPRRTDRDTLYNHLLDDLKIATDLVPWRNEVTAIGDVLDERITKGTVKALRARIALYRGGFSLRLDGTMKRGSDSLTYYQIAKTECAEIIASGQHALNPSYRALWKDQVGAHAVTDPQGELMFQASAFGLSGAEDTKLGFYNGPSVTVGVTSYGNKSINVVPTYFYAFDSTDLRRDIAICPYNLVLGADNVTLTKTGQAFTAINDGKYRRDWVSNPTIAPASYATQYLGLKWQIMRYADVLLMFAEAENALNSAPTPAAFNAINQVRRRGYGKSITAVDPIVDLPATLNKNTFFDAIVKERSLELGGEGIRKYDLIRWNLLAKKIADTKAALLDMSNSAGIYATLPTSMYYKTGSVADDKTLWANSFYVPAPTSTPAGTTKVTWVSAAINTTALARFATGFTTGKSELLPIPQAARDANPNFSQNFG
ncbi:MAG: RagB/SusD family nutrient uptake outer membrane protein, partial [Pedobacter sp.]|nr:RagB/SusD family nutrient uptake outer membrane protein [Chitinophagaceae bacterium]